MTITKWKCDFCNSYKSGVKSTKAGNMCRHCRYELIEELQAITVPYKVEVYRDYWHRKTLAKEVDLK